MALTRFPKFLCWVCLKTYSLSVSLMLCLVSLVLTGQARWVDRSAKLSSRFQRKKVK